MFSGRNAYLLGLHDCSLKASLLENAIFLLKQMLCCSRLYISTYIDALLLQALQQVDDGWKPLKKKDERSNHSDELMMERDEKCLDAPQVP